jgi:hypothetical protein
MKKQAHASYETKPFLPDQNSRNVIGHSLPELAVNDSNNENNKHGDDRDCDHPICSHPGNPR